MARELEKLSAAAIKNANKPGMYGDGGGLWLHVGPNAVGQDGKPTKTGKSWVFRFMLDGKAREMGLGPLHTIGLSEARELARACRKKVLEGTDPLEAKHAKRKARKLEAAKAITFKACAAKYITANKAGWRNEKHADQWENTLTTYVYPLIGGLAVSEIDTGHITRVLEPIWTTKSETASRVRGRSSNRSSVTPRRTTGGPGKTPPGGAGTWKTSCPRNPRWRRSRTMPPSPGVRAAHS